MKVKMVPCDHAAAMLDWKGTSHDDHIRHENSSRPLSSLGAQLVFSHHSLLRVRIAALPTPNAQHRVFSHRPPLPFLLSAQNAAPPPPLLHTADHRPWVEQPGQMLDLYETTLRYPNLPNVDMAFIFGDEMSAQGSYELWPLLIPFKGNEHKSAILVPNSGHYRCGGRGEAMAAVAAADPFQGE